MMYLHGHSLVVILYTVWTVLSGSEALSFGPPVVKKPTRCCHKLSGTSSGETTRDKSTGDDTPSNIHFVFPGGGIFFYHQAGIVSYLREEGYDLTQVTLAGASAGALTATLTAANVDFYDATGLALDLAEEEGVWDRTVGLQGVWGNMIERWLEILLPTNVVDIIGNRLTLLVTPIPSFGKSKVSDFRDKTDLIRCNMASVHLPLFLDSKFTSMFREEPHIDGSFLASREDYLPSDDNNPQSVLTLDWKADPAMEGKALEFVSVISKEGIWGLLEQGKKFGKLMDERGDFKCLPRCSTS